MPSLSLPDNTTTAAAQVAEMNGATSFDDLTASLDNTGGPRPKRAVTKAAPPKPASFDDVVGRLDKPDTYTPGAGGSGAETIDPNDYRFNTKAGQDNNLLRAQDQSWEEQVGKTLLNLVPNIATGIAGSIGSLATLVQFGDDRTYSNDLTKKMEEWKNPFGEVYAEHPDQTTDWKDPAWWLQRGGGLAESVLQFVALGAGVGGVLGKGAEMIGAASGSARLASLLAKGAQGITAGALSYTEGAQMGAQVFQKAYDTNLLRFQAQGLNDAEAHAKAQHVASQAAATTVQLNTAITFGLNLSSVLPIFKSSDEITDFFRKGGGARLKGETAAAYGSRLAALGEDATTINRLVGKAGVGHLVTEGLQEGAEEMLQDWAQRSGERQGESGRSKGLFEQFDAFKDLLGDVTSEAAIVDGMFGLMGGVLNTVGLSRVPMHKDYVRENGNLVPELDAEGKPAVDASGAPVFKTAFYSPRTMANNQRMAYFNSNKEAIISDLDHIATTMDKVKALGAQGKTDAAQVELNNLLAVQHLHAVTMGHGDNLSADYDEIAQADNRTDLGEQAGKQAQEVAQQQAQFLKEQGVQDVSQLSVEAAEPFNQMEEQRKELLLQSSELAGVSPAMQQGYATSMKDNSFVTKAQEAKADLKEYNNWYEQTQKLFSYDSRNEEANVPKIVLHKMIQNNLYKRLLQKIDGQNAESRAQLNDLQGSPTLSTDQFNGVVQDYNRQVAKNSELGNHFGAEITKLRKAIADGDTKTFETMLSKYRIDYSDGDIVKAAKGLADKLVGIRDSKYALSQENETKIKDSLQFADWLANNEGKDFKDYIEALQQRTIDNQLLSQREQYAEQLRTEHDLLKEQIAQIQTNPQRYATSILRDFERASQAEAEKVKAENDGLSQRDREIAAAAKLDARQSAQVKAALELRISDMLTSINEAKAQIATMTGTEQRSKLGKLIQWTIDPNLRTAQTRVANLESQLALLQSELAKIDANVGNMPEVDEEDESPELEAIPGTIAARIESWAGSINSAQSVDDIRAQIRTELMLEGLDMSAITPQSIDDLIVRAMTLSKRAPQKSADSAIQALADLIGTTGNPELVKETVAEILTKQAPFSWDALIMHQAMEFLDAPMAAKIMSKVNDILNGVQVAEEEVEEEDEVPEEVTIPELPNTPETPETEAESPTSTPLPTPDAPSELPVIGKDTTKGSKAMFHVGTKSVSALRINRLDLNYREDVADDAYNIESSSNIINRNLSDEMLKHGGIKPGTTVKFVVDKDWVGSVNNITEPGKTPENFDQYIDKDGKLVAAQSVTDNFPIKIVDQAGNTLGYLPRVDWVLTKYEGATNYRNIAEVTDDEGAVISDAQSEAARLRSVRAQIAKFHNTNGGEISTFVTERGPGHLIMNVDENGMTKPGPATELLPETSLELGIADHGLIRTGKASTSSKQLSMSELDALNLNDNAPYAVVPMPDGRFSVAPLYNNSIQPHETKTMLEVIRAYLAGDEKILAKVEELTGFDPRSAEGLRAFINQHYTFTNSFAESVLRPSMDAEATPRFLFNIANERGAQKGSIYLGTAYSGRAKIEARLDGGQLNEDFVKAFERGMKGRYKNIVFEDNQRGLKGLNSAGQLNEVVFANRVIKVRKSHASYNDYVKSFSQTPVNGTNQLSSGEFVYGVHASANLDMQSVIAARPQRKTEVKIPEAAVPLAKPVVTNKPINVYYGSGENKELSNLATRPFKFQDKQYFSVEHAYQTLKSGRFDEATYKKYKSGGIKIVGGMKANNATNIALMEDLIRESFQQNPAAAEQLSQTGTATITHTQDPGIWKTEFPRILSKVRSELQAPSNSLDNDKAEIANEIAKMAMFPYSPHFTPEQRVLYNENKAEIDQWAAQIARDYDSQINPEPKFSQEDADLLDDGFMDFMPSFEQSSVTLQTLGELYTFTPEASRNGKSPQAVMAELKRLGMNQLPPDFNPFLKC